MSTKRIKLVVAYDGTDFSGWAAQPERRTVRSTLTDAVRQISGEENEIIGASRTDSGAHALAQVCHFDTECPIPTERWVRALNKLLPLDVAVQDAKEVPVSFHSRFCALDRSYRYRIATVLREPRLSRYAHDFGRPLDLKAMQAAASSLEGKHDFRAYSEELEPSQNAIRELFRVQVTGTRTEVRIDVRGTAFVRGMMRRIAGGLLEVGRGKRPPEDLARLLDERLRDSLQWPVVLPARGLTLMRVRYGRHPVDVRDRNETNEFETERLE